MFNEHEQILIKKEYLEKNETFFLQKFKNGKLPCNPNRAWVYIAFKEELRRYKEKTRWNVDRTD